MRLSVAPERYYRVGQIVPSSNTTMETEIPAMLRAREGVAPERFTFHSGRMRMQHVTKEELAKMDGDSDRCALELSDAPVDVLGYACLVAIMSMGHGYHRESERRLRERRRQERPRCASRHQRRCTGRGLRTLGAKRVSIVTPYMKPLTELVKSYIEAEEIEVLDTISLEISNNIQVGSRDPLALTEISKDLQVKGADAVVISACVQMPSLESIPAVEERIGLPVVSAAVCTTYQMLKQLGLKTSVPNAGALLSGRY